MKMMRIIKLLSGSGFAVILFLSGTAIGYDSRYGNYDEKRAETLKIQQERAAQQHQRDMELVKQGANPSDLQQKRDQENAKRKMRQLQMEMDALKARQQ